MEKGENLKLQILSSSQLSIPAEPSDVLWPNGDDQGNITTAAEYEMGVSWTEEVGLLRKTRKGLTG